MGKGKMGKRILFTPPPYPPPPPLHSPEGPTARRGRGRGGGEGGEGKGKGRKRKLTPQKIDELNRNRTFNTEERNENRKTDGGFSSSNDKDEKCEDLTREVVEREGSRKEKKVDR